jgi:hypothetical protein
MSSLRAIGIAAALAVLSVASVASAQATPFIVAPGSPLEIGFTVPHPLPTITCCGGTYPMDLIDFSFRAMNVIVPFATEALSWALYNGSTLLGVSDNHETPFATIFQSATSLYHPSGLGDNGVVVDWSSFTDGSILGRVVLTLSDGEFSFNATDLVADLGLGSVNGGTFGMGPFLDLTLVSPPNIPEAPTLALIGFGLLGLAGMRVLRPPSPSDAGE